MIVVTGTKLCKSPDSDNHKKKEGVNYVTDPTYHTPENVMNSRNVGRVKLNLHGL
jgi:hypothetical protein